MDDLTRWRKLADCDALAGAPLGEALRTATDEVERLRELTATCTCGDSYATYEGPQPGCPVHGAIRAFNVAQVDLSHAKRSYEELAKTVAGTVNARVQAEVERDALKDRVAKMENGYGRLARHSARQTAAVERVRAWHRPMHIYDGDAGCLEDGGCVLGEDYPIGEEGPTGGFCPHTRLAAVICFACSYQDTEGEGGKWPRWGWVLHANCATIARLDTATPINGGTMSDEWQQRVGHLIEITANLEAHIERRAQEIAAPRIAEVEATAIDRAAELEREVAIAEQRLTDLQGEAQRQVGSLERRIERREAERGALRAANERAKEIARHPRTSQGRVKDYVDAALVLAALDTSEETPDDR